MSDISEKELKLCLESYEASHGAYSSVVHETIVWTWHKCIERMSPWLKNYQGLRHALRQILREEDKNSKAYHIADTALQNRRR